MNKLADKLFEFKYSPKSIEEMILPNNVKKVFKKWIYEDPSLFNNCLLVSNKPGCGKTSITRLIIDSKNFATLFINGARETSIDNVRYNIKNFVSTVSMLGMGNPKIVILDEADRLSPQALDALKSEIELAQNNARFVFTANRRSAFPEPIISRTQEFNFDKIFSDNKTELYKLAFVKIKHILDNEKIEYEQEAIVNLIKKYGPDWRGLIKTIQLLASYNNTITSKEVKNIDVKEDINSLIEFLKMKNFKKIREFSIKHIGNEISVMEELYKLVKTDIILKESIPKYIIYLAELNRNCSIVPDPEIELMAAFMEIMENIKFK